MSDKATALVQQMVDAGEWANPRLLDEILAEGKDAVEPLLKIVRQHPHGWPQEAPLLRALSLLAILHPPEAISPLLGLFREYDDEGMFELLAEALVGFGAELVEPALAVVQDFTLSYHARAQAAMAAAHAVQGNAEWRPAVAAVLRELLAECLALVGEARANSEDGEDNEDREEDYFDNEDDLGYQLMDPVTDLVWELADLADVQGRDLIKDAFEAQLVDPEVIDEATVDEHYGEHPPPPEPFDPHALLTEYRAQYRDYEAEQRRATRGGRRATAAPSPPPLSESPEPFGPSQPFYKTEKPGRNDPCWCGSGKKYKKCHMQQDQQ
ncbi:MAG TPA: SEC-C domain-containing protein [Gemmataceae bacterium]|nr:SEC-C domain-containing protein [Gemmataceae bacterium]